MAVAMAETPAVKTQRRKAASIEPAAADAAATAATSSKKKRKQPVEPDEQAAEKPAARSDDAPAATDGAAADGTSADAATDQPAAHKKRRRKTKQDEAPPTDASPEELARRAHQKERQALARRLQAAGRPYKRQKPHKDKAANQGQAGVQQPGSKGSGQAQPGSGHGGSGVAARGKGSREAPWETGNRPDHPVAVIIVPIFWLKREHEMKEVLQAAAAVEKLLAAVGIDVGVDSTTPMSPGQKYRYWEMKGVKVRLEIGPTEAQYGGCIISLSATPGEVANKTPLKVGQKLLDTVRKQLQLPTGNAAADADVLRQHGPAAGAGPRSGGRGASGSGGLRIGRLSGNKGGDAGSIPTGKHTVFGGDDLDDDFLREAEPEPTANAKKKKMAPTVDVPQPPQPAMPSKKAAKLVTF